MQQIHGAQVSEEDQAVEMLQGQLRSEIDWLRMTQGQLISLTLSPDQIALQTVPRGTQPTVLTVDPRIQVYHLKEQLCKALSVGLTPQRIIIRGTNLNVALKDSLSLAFFNIANGSQLLYSVKNVCT